MSLSGPRADAFPRARDLFERSRSEWLPRFVGQWAVIRDGQLVGIFADAQSAGKSADLSRDDTFLFLIRSQEDEDAWLLKQNVRKWACICEPFLDTDDPEGVWNATRILELRGYTRSRIRILRLLALTGLWWNAFWWEWEGMDLWHVLVGWSFNCALICPLAAAIIWITVGPLSAILVAAVTLFGAGLFVRAASRRNKTESSRHDVVTH